MTKEELEAIKARTQAATPGPWGLKEVVDYTEHWYQLFPDVGVYHGLISGDRHLIIGCDHCEVLFLGHPDAEFICNSREDVPKLLDEIERLQGELSKTTAILGRILSDTDKFYDY